LGSLFNVEQRERTIGARTAAESALTHRHPKNAARSSPGPRSPPPLIELSSLSGIAGTGGRSIVVSGTAHECRSDKPWRFDGRPKEKRNVKLIDTRELERLVRDTFAEKHLFSVEAELGLSSRPAPVGCAACSGSSPCTSS
jgi:hypothetical protein